MTRALSNQLYNMKHFHFNFILRATTLRAESTRSRSISRSPSPLPLSRSQSPSVSPLPGRRKDYSKGMVITYTIMTLNYLLFSAKLPSVDANVFFFFWIFFKYFHYCRTIIYVILSALQ